MDEAYPSIASNGTELHFHRRTNVRFKVHERGILNGSDNIFWIDAKIIAQFRPDALN